MKKLWRKFLCRLLNRHRLALYVNWAPDTICAHITCEHCDESFGHFYLPVKPRNNVYSNGRYLH